MKTTTVTLDGPRGATSAQVYEPDRPGSGRVAVAFAVEATGMNAAGLAVVQQLVEKDMVVIAPDYYRGDGPADPESYDIPELVRCIGELDFATAFTDLLAAVDHVRAREDVDGARVVSWGYCTGGTLAWAAAALDRRLAAAVIYYPSQPTFAATDERHPFNVLDLTSVQVVPTLFIVGSEDDVLTPPVREAIRRKSALQGELHEVVVYPGAKHAFAGSMPGRHDAEATASAWTAALGWVAAHTGTGVDDGLAASS
jgi:carboxymethylenebutenolidase